MLQSFHLCSPLLHIMCLFVPYTEKVRTGHSSLVVASPELRRGAGSPSLDWLATLLLMQSRIPLAFFATGVHVQLDVPQDALILLHRAAFHLGGLQHTLVLEVFLLTCRMLHLSLLNLMKFLSDHFSSLLKPDWMAA